MSSSFDDLLSAAKENEALQRDLLNATDFKTVIETAEKFGVELKPTDLFRHYLEIASQLPDDELENMLGTPNMSLLTFACTLYPGCPQPDPGDTFGNCPPDPGNTSRYCVTIQPICPSTIGTPCR
jgi:hypothetical protein